MKKLSSKFSTGYKEMWQAQQYSFFEPLTSYPLERHPDKHNIAYMMAGSALFCSDINVASALYEKACSLTKEPPQIQKFMLAALNIQFGRALLLADQQAKALEKFIEAWQMGNALLKPLFYGFMCEAAEQLLNAGDSRAAIQAWQDIATVLQQETPEYVYHRMSHCYAVNSMGFGGTPEQNQLWGDCYKHDVLAYFHAHLQPDFYFEIGVDEGQSLVRARGKALGVDARPTLNLKVDLPDTAKILGMSSDAFFKKCAVAEFSQSPDLAFIDGMHLFEFALRDFINFERFAAPNTLVVIDDIFPCHPIQAERRRVTGTWAGDVWKLLPILRKYRPDLLLMPLKSYTTGLLLIAGLDPNNTALSDNYADIMADYRTDMSPPDTILARAHSVASDHAAVDILLFSLKKSKTEQLDYIKTKQLLTLVEPFLTEALANSLDDYKPEKISNLSVRQQLKQLSEVHCQLFLPQAQDPVYSEACSLRRTFAVHGVQHLAFNFEQALSKQPLRFDPATAPGLFEILSIKLTDMDNNTLLALTDSAELNRLALVGDAIKLVGTERYVFYVYGGDPIIMLPVIEVSKRKLSLVVELKAISEQPEQQLVWLQHSKSRPV
ncbi:class I SAM-dependent methyltransferase [Rheinheimera sp. KL1]|uniref:class I SAM-dependent methyltransferase n=1 Tax=Rheinheimera sp. KL1 TaxID=1635005 RepID=UPI0006A96374|nr:class I SAM-dependent methyltransferase [Rheinheimera sp. KL1]